MKKFFLFAICLLMIAPISLLYAKSPEKNENPSERSPIRQSSPQKIRHVEPGRTAFSFQAFGDIPLNQEVHKTFRSGMGFGGRLGYGFWEGLSLEGDFQYDVLFHENGPQPDEGNKNLWTVAPGLRYTTHLIQDDISGYVLSLVGITVDYTKGNTSAAEFSFAVGTGLDFNLTENFSVGPALKYRLIVEKTDIHLMNIGAAFTYLFN